MSITEMPKVIPDRQIGCVQSPVPGPTLIVVGAVHGNEPAGVHASRAVLKRLQSGRGIERGRFVALLGNRRAFAQGVRYFDRDLNRSFPVGSFADPAQTDDHAPQSEDVELLELIEALGHEHDCARGPMYLVDVHTVSSKSPPFIAVEDSLPGRRLAGQFGLPLLLGVEEELTGLLFDYFTHAFDGLGLVVEAGQHEEPNTTRMAEAILWRALEAVGLVPYGLHDTSLLENAASFHAGCVFDVRHRHVIRSSDFSVIESIHALDRVRVGTPIGTEAGEPVLAPEPGLVVMPNRQQEKRVGDDGYFIVKPVGRFWLWASARMRQRRWIHGALPILMPGVRARPGNPGQLLVSPRVATIMKRQLFHLLGYRLIRHTHEQHLGPVARLGLGVIHLAGTIRLLIVGLLRGGEPSALPCETEDDWIVARRHLDTIPSSRFDQDNERNGP